MNTFFFWGGGWAIRISLKELNIVFMMDKKQIQIVQELKLTDCKNSEIEKQCVKPQI